MRTLEVIKEFDKNTFESPHRLILNSEKTGVRWNGDTKKELYGDNPVQDSAEELAFIFVSELDQELGFIGDSLTKEEKVSFYNQLTEHLEGYPD